MIDRAPYKFLHRDGVPLAWTRAWQPTAYDFTYHIGKGLARGEIGTILRRAACASRSFSPVYARSLRSSVLLDTSVLRTTSILAGTESTHSVAPDLGATAVCFRSRPRLGSCELALGRSCGLETNFPRLHYLATAMGVSFPWIAPRSSFSVWKIVGQPWSSDHAGGLLNTDRVTCGVRQTQIERYSPAVAPFTPDQWARTDRQVSRRGSWPISFNDTHRPLENNNYTRLPLAWRRFFEDESALGWTPSISTPGM